ncbi:MAG: protease HtpX [Betaproteobacteria bacterium]|nr:protease HtpX [Betaproteobacteria bacterium]
MKRVVIFLLTNIAVMAVLFIIVRVLGIDGFLTANGLNLPMLLAFSAVMGFGGAFISLLLSKTMAKWSTGAQIIQQPRDANEQWLVATVRELSQKAGIAMPEVAIYEGEPNAFATGAFKNSALVAVSTGLLASMTRDEVEAVLAHEVAHVANGDMVTLTLVQGVVNTFVVFFARIVGYIVDRIILKNDREVGVGYYVASFVAQMIFGVLAMIIVAWFSRRREFRADAGAAQYMGTPTSMVNALARLGGLAPGVLPKSFAASGISGGAGIMALFSTHPPIGERIRALGGQITQNGGPTESNQAFGRGAPAANHGFGRSAR